MHNRDTKYYIENVCHQSPDLFNQIPGEFQVQQHCNFTKKRLQHRCFPVNIANFKNTYFEKLRTADSDSSYILHTKLNKIIQEADWPSGLASCFS